MSDDSRHRHGERIVKIALGFAIVYQGIDELGGDENSAAAMAAGMAHRRGQHGAVEIVWQFFRRWLSLACVPGVGADTWHFHVERAFLSEPPGLLAVGHDVPEDVAAYHVAPIRLHEGKFV